MANGLSRGRTKSLWLRGRPRSVVVDLERFLDRRVGAFGVVSRDRSREIARSLFSLAPPVGGLLCDVHGLFPVGHGDLDVEPCHAIVGCEADHTQHTRHFQAREHAIEPLEDLVERVARFGELLILLVARDHHVDAFACRDQESLDLLAVSHEGVHVDLAELAAPGEELIGERVEPRAVSPLSIVPRVGLQLAVDEGVYVHEERLVGLDHFAQVSGRDGGCASGLLTRLAHLDDASRRALDAEYATVPVAAAALERTAFVVHAQQPLHLFARELRVLGFAEHVEEREMGRERPGHLVIPSVQVVHEVLGQLGSHLVEGLCLRGFGGLHEKRSSKRAEESFAEVLHIEEGDAVFGDLFHPDHIAGDEVPADVARLHHSDLGRAQELEGDGLTLQEEAFPAIAGEARLGGEHGLGEPRGTDHGDLGGGGRLVGSAELARLGYLS